MVNLRGIESYNNVASLQDIKMKIDNSLDYAAHELKIKRLMKELHEYLLRNDFVSAASTIDHAIVELRLMRAAVKNRIKE